MIELLRLTASPNLLGWSAELDDFVGSFLAALAGPSLKR
jgi:hypothetical protein